jgi:hypothetical protein
MKARQAVEQGVQLLKADLQHPSLDLKKVDNLWSAPVVCTTVGSQSRCLMACCRFWTGTHAEYDDMLV